MFGYINVYYVCCVKWEWTLYVNENEKLLIQLFAAVQNNHYYKTILIGNKNSKPTETVRTLFRHLKPVNEKFYTPMFVPCIYLTNVFLFLYSFCHFSAGKWKTISSVFAAKNQQLMSVLLHRVLGCTTAFTGFSCLQLLLLGAVHVEE